MFRNRGSLAAAQDFAPPALDPDVAWALEAFDHLSRDRQMGFSAGPIPWTAIDRYARRHGIKGEMFTDLVRFIIALDSEFLDHISNKESKGEKR